MTASVAWHREIMTSLKTDSGVLDFEKLSSVGIICYLGPFWGSLKGVPLSSSLLETAKILSRQVYIPRSSKAIRSFISDLEKSV